jgi:RNA polymerase sigma factor (sigma-70 family)
MEVSIRREYGYNVHLMRPIQFHSGIRNDSPSDWAELVAECARDRHNAAAWSEFMRRYGPRIQQFTRSALRGAIGGLPHAASSEALLGGMQENDLFQTAILRLVQGDCAVMTRFSGTTEDEWIAYLAVITRSVVRDSMRVQRRYKRAGGVETSGIPRKTDRRLTDNQESLRHPATDRSLLAKEIRALGERILSDRASETASRDRLIFRLYFDHDLTPFQISKCQGVNLTKTGVEKVIHRIRDHIRSVVAPAPSEVVEP